MTTTQQQLRFVEFAEAVRRKRSRPENPYEYDDSSVIHTNHGNKLKRNAHFVQEGQLDLPRGLTMFPKQINYSGYRRRIISRNPLLFDDDGDVVDEEDELEDGEAAPLEENPYEDIKLQDLLRPLTAAAELPKHPRLSAPYYDTGLPEMVQNAQDMLHKEQAMLWKLKDIFTTFRGDTEWIPVGNMRSAYDDWLLATVSQRTGMPMGDIEDKNQGRRDGIPAPLRWNIDQNDAADSRSQNAEAARINGNTDVDMTDTASENGKDALAANRMANGVSNGVSNGVTNGRRDGASHAEARLGHGHGHTSSRGVGANDESNNNNDEDEEQDEDNREPTPPLPLPLPPPQRMTTRALASAPQNQNPSPSPPLPSQTIHPFFLAHPSDASHPSPSNPEDDPLPSLLSYISKQEEIVRLADELYQGLLRALRMRKEVLSWCKAEGHVGEMSDGEDWVDYEQWGLEQGELVKGREEDDNDNGPEVIGSGRRGRRGGRGGGAAGAAADRV